MNYTALIALLQVALSLLIAVQSNPALPPSLSQEATQLAQQAITQAQSALSFQENSTSQNNLQVASPQTGPTGGAKGSQTLQQISQASMPTVPVATAPTTSVPRLHFCPVIVPQQCSTPPTADHDAYGCVTAYTCAPSPNLNNAAHLGPAVQPTSSTAGGSCTYFLQAYANGSVVSMGYDIPGCQYTTANTCLAFRPEVCTNGTWIIMK